MVAHDLGQLRFSMTPSLCYPTRTQNRYPVVGTWHSNLALQVVPTRGFDLSSPRFGQLCAIGHVPCTRNAGILISYSLHSLHALHQGSATVESTLGSGKVLHSSSSRYGDSVLGESTPGPEICTTVKQQQENVECIDTREYAHRNATAA